MSTTAWKFSVQLITVSGATPALVPRISIAALSFSPANPPSGRIKVDQNQNNA